LEDALLDPLQFVARAGQQQDQEEVDHRGDRELRLPDADRLDQHDVVARRLADEQRLPRAACHPAERAGRRARANEGLGGSGQPPIAASAAAPSRSRMRPSTRRAAFGIAVPGPKTAFTPACSRNAWSRDGMMPPTMTMMSRAPERSSSRTSWGTSVLWPPDCV